MTLAIPIGLCLVAVALLGIALWLEHRDRLALGAEAKAYQVASNQRHNTLMGMLREVGIEVGWDDSKAKTMALDPVELAKWRRETGPRER